MSEIADQCPSSVYDEFSVPIDPRLFNAILEFSAEGVDVRVYNVETMTDEGARLTDNMSDEEFFENAADHTEKIFEVCDIPTDNALLLVRASDDRYLDIVTAGAQTDFWEDHRSTYNNISDRYLEDAQSGGTDTLDTDAAVALERLYEYEFGNDDRQQAEKAEQAEQPVATPAKDIESTPARPVTPMQDETGSPGVAVEPTRPTISRGEVEVVGVALAAATVLTLLIGGFRKRSDAKADFADAKQMLDQRLNSDSEVVTAIFDGLDDEQSFMDLLPDDENPKLKLLWAEVVNGQDQWNTLHGEIRGQLDGLGGFWPPVTRTQELRNRYDTTSRDYIRKVREYTDQIQELTRLKEGLQKQHGQAAEALQDARDMFLRLTQVDDGATAYEIPGMEEKIRAYEARLAGVGEQVASGYIQQPQAEYATLFDELRRTTDQLEAVPADRAHVIELYKTAVNEIASSAKQLTMLRDSVNGIKDAYADDCWADIEEKEDLAAGIYADIEAAKAHLADPSTVYNTATLAAIAQSVHEVTPKCEEVSRLASAVNSHKNKLIGIAEDLPDQTRRTWAALEEARDYIEANSEFIDDPTEQELIDLVPLVERLQEELEGTKPSYLRLQQEASNVHKAVAVGFKRAKDEHQEYMQLVAGVSDKTNQFERELASLRGYEAQHGDVDRDTEADIEELELPGLPTERSRAALRRANDLLDEAIDNVQSVMQDARSDVRREEERREAELEAQREAIRRAEAVKRAAEQAAEQAERDRKRAREQREEATRLATRMSKSTFLHSPHRGGVIGHGGRRG